MTVGVWNWPETMALLRLLIQGAPINKIANTLGRAPNTIKVRIDDLYERYPDVMERIKPVDIIVINSRKTA